MEAGTERHLPKTDDWRLCSSIADEEHSVFVRKLHYYIIFRFISTSYDAHLRIRRRQ